MQYKQIALSAVLAATALGTAQAATEIQWWHWMTAVNNEWVNDLAKQFKHWHELLGNAGYWLIGLHAAAGLFHHYWVQDNTLTRMLPGRSRDALNQRQP